MDKSDIPNTYLITDFLWNHIGDFIYTHESVYIQVFERGDYKSILEYIKNMTKTI